MCDDEFIPKAFFVKNVSNNFDPSVPPSTGEEYLQQVMYEASQCPDVVVANLDRKKLKNHVNYDLNPEDEKIAASDLAPSVEWQLQQVAIFSSVRQRVARCRSSGRFQPVPLPKPKEEKKWHDLCIGEKKIAPTLSVMLSMNEAILGRLLEYHVEWLEEEGLQPEQGKWLYALLACLDLPLHTFIYSIIRDLARQCARLRLTKTSKEDSDVVVLNLIICLVGKYFGQTDLADSKEAFTRS